MKKLIAAIFIIGLIGIAGCSTAAVPIDTSGDPILLQFDGPTGDLVTIDEPHNEIHEGNSYTVSDVQAVDTTTIQWQITTPDTSTYAHMLFKVDCTGEMLVTITEGSDRDDGTALSEINRNRKSSKTATVIVTRTPTNGTTDGTVTIYSAREGTTGMGPVGGALGGSRGNDEFILKANTKYVVSVTTYAGVYVSAEFDWYEHTM